MQVATVRELGFLVRDHRRARGWSQAHLAATAGVSRRWVYEFEGGRKPGAELDRCLRVLAALGLVLDVADADATEPPGAPATAVDLDEHLADYGPTRT